MNEHLLQGLMHLFAIISKLDGNNDEERQVVRGFLGLQLNLEETERFLAIFDAFVDDHSRIRNKNARFQLTTRDSTKMVVICNEINQEMTQQQKVQVVFMLFSLVNADENISPTEYDFLSTAAEIFNISQAEFHLIEKFALPEKLLVNYDNENLLIISNQVAEYNHTHTMVAPEMEGYLGIIRLADIGCYMVKYSGPETYLLNGLPMRSNQIYTLSVGSTIRGNKIPPIYFSDIVSQFLKKTARPKISFVADNISYRFPKGNIGLHELTISESEGNLIGLMGPSGAGKSTLLEVLNGNITPTTGSVLINTINLHKNKQELEGIIGYVPQDDLLIEELSVFENLYYAAKLCFGDYSELELKKRVDETLQSLGLAEIAQYKVGGPLNKVISGGQRKRVNIALELLRAPSVLFLDEPTSGLSSRDSLSIMDLLKELSHAGKLIFVVIHQPSSDIFKMFDKLFILDKGGYPVYYGNPVEAIIYFKTRINQINRDQAVCPECGNVNPEQIFDIIETKTVDQFGKFTESRKITPQTWHGFFLKHIAEPEKFAVPEKLQVIYQKANAAKQLLAFTARDFKSKINNNQYLIINSLQAPFLATVLAILNRYTKIDELTGLGEYSFFNNSNIPVYFFISVIIAIFMGLTVSAEEIFHDRKILKREAFLNLSRGSYLTSKLVILFSISALQMLSFVLIGNWILDIKGMTFEYWLVLFSCSCFANMLGLNISSAFNSAVTIYILIPILLIPQLVLGGIVIPFEKLNPIFRAGNTVPLVGEIMTSRWAFEALMINQFKDNPYEAQFFAADQKTKNFTWYTDFLIPELQGKANTVQQKYEEGGNKALLSVTYELGILKKYLTVEIAKNPDFHFKQINFINQDGYTQQAGDSLQSSLNKMLIAYSDSLSRAKKEKSRLENSLTNTPEKAKLHSQNKFKYANEGVINTLEKAYEGIPILAWRDELQRKFAPVYIVPAADNGFFNFRTHFYSSSKYFAGRYFQTLTFNLMVIWFMTLLLFVSLYFNLLTAFLELPGSIAGKFKKKK